MAVLEARVAALVVAQLAVLGVLLDRVELLARGDLELGARPPAL